MNQLINNSVFSDFEPEDFFEFDAFEEPERTPEELYLLVKWGDSGIDIED